MADQSRAHFREFQVSNDILWDAEALRQRIDEEGYLFFRRLVDVDTVLSLRTQVLACLRDAGWLIPGSSLDDGIADISKRCIETDLEYQEAYGRVQRLEAFHRLVHYPSITDVFRKLFGEPVLPHAMAVCRLMFPQNTAYTTAPHQDFVHVQGTTKVYTFWMPLGPSPRELGGLSILPRSHRAGVYQHHAAAGVGFLGIDDADLTGDWLSTDFGIGDALIFHSLTPHGALPSQSRDRMRISADFRYQAASEPITIVALKPHLTGIHGLSWEDIYAGWRSKEFQYYWKDFDLRYAPRSMRYYDDIFEETLERAEQGDARVRPMLQFFSTRHPNADLRQRAAAAVPALDARRGQSN